MSNPTEEYSYIIFYEVSTKLDGHLFEHSGSLDAVSNSSDADPKSFEPYVLDKYFNLLKDLDNYKITITYCHII